MQGHVFQGGGEAQVAGPPGCSDRYAQHLQLLPEVSAGGGGGGDTLC